VRAPMFGTRLAHQERDIAARLRQPSAEIATGRAGSDNENPHVLSPLMAGVSRLPMAGRGRRTRIGPGIGVSQLMAYARVAYYGQIPILIKRASLA